MSVSPKKHIYFASDFHLGIHTQDESIVREKKIVRWLESIKHNAAEIYLVGDLFDFWFEYKTVVPKGFTRLLGKLAELADSGVKLHLFQGNHDLWQFGYLQKEIGCNVYAKPITITIGKHVFHIAHGDGLGPNQRWFKFILSIYRNYFFQRLFAFFHPNIGIGIANWFSAQSKKQTHHANAIDYGENEFLWQYAQEFLTHTPIDYFVFGHRHLPATKKLNPNATYVNLGDWMQFYTYAVYDGETLTLHTFEEQ